MLMTKKTNIRGYKTMRIIILLLSFFCACIILPCHGFAENTAGRYGKLSKPTEGMSINDLMKLSYHLKFTKDCKDYECWGEYNLVNKKDMVLNREWHRYRTVLNRLSDGINYKDILVIEKPQNIKGMAVLIWTYLDQARDDEMWLWLPSLRKVRRTSQLEDDDSVFGTDFNYEEMFSGRYESDTYRLIREDVFPGYTSSYSKQEYNKDVPCYLIEATPTRKNWYYEKKHMYLDKKTACNIFEEYFDSEGVKMKTISRFWSAFRDAPYLTEDFDESRDLRSGHYTPVDIKDVVFDKQLPENMFTERYLMRGKW
jgi:hypothetical protein